MDEKTLLEKARSGDRKSLELLLYDNYKIVYGYLLKLTMNEEVTKDLTQDVMMKAILNIKKFKGESKFSTWLISIASNLYKNYIRKNEKTSNKTIEDLKIGYVPQHLHIEKNTPMSVYDLFAGYISRTPVFLKKSKKVYDFIKERLSIFDAQDLIDKRACDLSGGELQRVLLAIAITPMPNLLLLDEPVSGIDRNGMELFYNNIQKIKENFDLAMIVVSHDFEFVKKYADHVVLLDKTILKEGTFDEVSRCEDFVKVFGRDYNEYSV